MGLSAKTVFIIEETESQAKRRPAKYAMAGCLLRAVDEEEEKGENVSETDSQEARSTAYCTHRQRTLSAAATKGFLSL